MVLVAPLVASPTLADYVALTRLMQARGCSWSANPSYPGLPEAPLPAGVFLLDDDGDYDVEDIAATTMSAIVPTIWNHVSIHVQQLSGSEASATWSTGYPPE